MPELSEVQQAKDEAKRNALEKIKAKARDEAGEDAKEDLAARLENAANFLDQLKEVRHKAADLLDRAEKAGDLKASGVFLRELREQIRLWAELEGKLAAQPQVNILVNSEWIELRALIIKALDPYPEAKEAVVNAIRRG
jgi:lysyl-tRNA synthetase class I